MQTMIEVWKAEGKTEGIAIGRTEEKTETRSEMLREFLRENRSLSELKNSLESERLCSSLPTTRQKRPFLPDHSGQ